VVQPIADAGPALAAAAEAQTDGRAAS